MKTNIYDGRNAVVGWTIEDAHTIRIYDRTGRFLGYYVKSSDITHTTHGFFGRGNQVLRLLP
ncbi:MAG: hypothetical protein AB9869_16525 [Verrucomicrobiia bacterium]